jgi:hypothetical protein
MINMYRLPILLILNDIVSCGSWAVVINVQVEQGSRRTCTRPHTGAYMSLNMSVDQIVLVIVTVVIDGRSATIIVVLYLAFANEVWHGEAIQ